MDGADEPHHEPREAPLPKRPYRDTLLLNVGLGGLILLLAWATGGVLARAVEVAIAFVVVATGWSWWRFHRRLRDRH